MFSKFAVCLDSAALWLQMNVQRGLKALAADQPGTVLPIVDVVFSPIPQYGAPSPSAFAVSLQRNAIHQSLMSAMETDAAFSAPYGRDVMTGLLGICCDEASVRASESMVDSIVDLPSNSASFIPFVQSNSYPVDITASNDIGGRPATEWQRAAGAWAHLACVRTGRVSLWLAAHVRACLVAAAADGVELRSVMALLYPRVHCLVHDGQWPLGFPAWLKNAVSVNHSASSLNQVGGAELSSDSRGIAGSLASRVCAFGASLPIRDDAHIDIVLERRLELAVRLVLAESAHPSAVPVSAFTAASIAVAGKSSNAAGLYAGDATAMARVRLTHAVTGLRSARFVLREYEEHWTIDPIAASTTVASSPHLPVPEKTASVSHSSASARTIAPVESLSEAAIASSSRRVAAHCWLRFDGSIDRALLRGLQHSICIRVSEAPGISVSVLAAQFPTITRHECAQLVAHLERAGRLTTVTERRGTASSNLTCSAAPIGFYGSQANDMYTSGSASLLAASTEERVSVFPTSITI
jgi:hypothetical protein